MDKLQRWTSDIDRAFKCFDQNRNLETSGVVVAAACSATPEIPRWVFGIALSTCASKEHVCTATSAYIAFSDIRH